MIEQDTVRLLRECDAGIKMGIASIDDVLDRVDSSRLQEFLRRCKQEHDQLQTDIHQLLDRCRDQGKDPNPIAKGMSKMKTVLKMGMDSSDSMIAELMIDGCHMGIKSLSRYLNQYKAADTQSREIAKRLICLEDKLATQLRSYL